MPRYRQVDPLAAADDEKGLKGREWTSPLGDFWSDEHGDDLSTESVDKIHALAKSIFTRGEEEVQVLAEYQILDGPKAKLSAKLEVRGGGVGDVVARELFAEGRGASDPSLPPPLPRATRPGTSSSPTSRARCWR